ncbi:MAG: hypothetical protein AAFU70_08195, partial [Planctomycetota bacterium]
KKIEGLGGTMRLGAQEVALTPGTLVRFLFGGADHVRERFRHRYEVEPAWIERLEQGGLVFSGRHPDQPIMQALELPRTAHEGAPGEGVAHPYFVAAQFHPELTSRPLRPQPLFMGLVAAAIRHRAATDEEMWRRHLADADLARWLPDAAPDGAVSVHQHA